MKTNQKSSFNLVGLSFAATVVWLSLVDNVTRVARKSRIGVRQFLERHAPKILTPVILLIAGAQLLAFAWTPLEMLPPLLIRSTLWLGAILWVSVAGAIVKAWLNNKQRKFSRPPLWFIVLVLALAANSVVGLFVPHSHYVLFVQLMNTSLWVFILFAAISVFHEVW